MGSRHRLSAGRHIGAGRLVRLIQDFYVGPNPCPDGSCNSEPCPFDNPDCCDPISGYGSDGLAATDKPSDRTFYRADELFSHTNGGATFTGLLGFGAINLLVPSHSQIFSENRNNLNDAAKDTHTATYNISTNLGFARYRKDYNAHDPMKEMSYAELKASMPLTPRMSMSSSARIDSLSTDKNSGGIDYQADRETTEPKIRTNLNVSNDPRTLFSSEKRMYLTNTNINPDGLIGNVSYATLPYSDIKTHTATFVVPAGRFFDGAKAPIGGYITKVKISEEIATDENSIIDPTSIAYSRGKVFYNTTETLDESGIPIRKAADVTTVKTSNPTLGTTPTRITTAAQDPDTGGGGNPGECGGQGNPCVCDGSNCNSDCDSFCGGGHVDCSNPSSVQEACCCQNCSNCNDPDPEPCDSHCEGCVDQIPCECPNPDGSGSAVCSFVCPEDECPPCSDCGCDLPRPCGNCANCFYCEGIPDDNCNGQACNDLGCGCFQPSPLPCLPPCPVCDIEECGTPDCLGVCDGPGCDGNQNLCCPESGSDCVECDDCPSTSSLLQDGSGNILSMMGNFTNRDLVPIGYFRHDLNLGNAGSIVSSNDTVLSSQLVLTVSEVYGRLPFVGAKPIAKPLKLNIYEVNQDIDPDTVSCSQYSAGNPWTSDSGRNTTDRSLNPISSVTIDTNVKPGDRIYINITDLARKSAAGNGVMNLMIEAAEWFDARTGSDVASDAKSKVSMLIQFHSTGNMRPKVFSNIMRSTSPSTSRLSPGVARRRAAAGL